MFRFLIFKETPLSLFLSILGAIGGCMALGIGSMAAYIMFEEMHAKESVGWWLSSLGFAVVAFIFYFIAYKSQKKTRDRRLETEREYAEKRFKLSEETKSDNHF